MPNRKKDADGTKKALTKRNIRANSPLKDGWDEMSQAD